MLQNADGHPNQQVCWNYVTFNWTGQAKTTKTKLWGWTSKIDDTYLLWQETSLCNSSITYLYWTMTMIQSMNHDWWLLFTETESFLYWGKKAGGTLSKNLAETSLAWGLVLLQVWTEEQGWTGPSWLRELTNWLQSSSRLIEQTFQQLCFSLSITCVVE